MRRRALLVALAVACPLVAAAGDGQPRLVVEPAEFDFGRVLTGSTLSREFRLRNDGDAPLVIEKVETSCGCTAAREDDSHIAPGGSSSLRVSLKTRSDRGHIVRWVMLRTNEPGARPHRIRLEATVVDDDQN